MLSATFRVIYKMSCLVPGCVHICWQSCLVKSDKSDQLLLVLAVDWKCISKWRECMYSLWKSCCFFYAFTWHEKTFASYCDADQTKICHYRLTGIHRIQDGSFHGGKQDALNHNLLFSLVAVDLSLCGSHMDLVGGGKILIALATRWRRGHGALLLP